MIMMMIVIGSSSSSSSNATCCTMKCTFHTFHGSHATCYILKYIVIVILGTYVGTTFTFSTSSTSM